MTKEQLLEEIRKARDAFEETRKECREKGDADNASYFEGARMALNYILTREAQQ